MPATFSVRIPLYNGGATIERTLHSLVAQSDPDWECLVVDDASTDDSVLRARWVDDERIRIEVAEQNVGMTANWNRALADPSGRYTVLLGHDDALTPDALAALRQRFETADDVAMVAFGARMLRPDGPDLHRARRHCGRIEPDVLRRFALLTTDTPAPSQAAYRTAVLAELLPLDTHFRYCPEIDLQYRLGAAGHAAEYLTECLALRGDAPDRVSNRTRQGVVPLRDHYLLLTKHAATDRQVAARQYDRLRRRGVLAALRALRHRQPRVAASFARTVLRGEVARRRTR